jgi:hypothetical protein
VKLRPALSLALALALVIALSLSACASSHAARRHVPFGFLGVLGGPPLGEPGFTRTDSELGAMAGIGVESLRIAFYWHEIQRDGPGASDFSRTDRIVAGAARARIRVLPTVLGVPRWARQDPAQSGSRPRSPAEFGTFMAALVDRYGPQGTFWTENPALPRRPIRDWQVWNEPDHTNFWHEQPYYAAYVRTLAAARRSIIARDPGAKVVLAGLVGRSWDQLEAIYRAGGRRHFDYGAVHPFTRLLPDVLRILRYNRQVMNRHGDAGKPMVATEVTWPSSKGRVRPPSAFDRTERDQAALLITVFRRLAAERARLRLRTVYWATWTTHDRSRTDAFDYTGLSAELPNGTLRRKPAFFAYRTIARSLEGCAKSTDATRCR